MKKKDSSNRLKISEDILKSVLEDYLNTDKTMEESCKKAGIDYETLRRYVSVHPEYKDVIDERKANRNPVKVTRNPEDPKVELKEVPLNFFYPLKMTDHEIYEALKEYLETGKSLKEIAGRYGVSGQTLRRYISLSPLYTQIIIEGNPKFVSRRRRDIDIETVEAIRTDYSEGLTLKECSEKYGMPMGAIYECIPDHSTRKASERIPKDLVPLIVKDYEKGGVSLQDLVDKYNLSVTPSCLVRHIKKAGISKMTHDNRKSPDDKKQAIVHDYFNTDLTIAQIAEKYGVSKKSVSNYADEARGEDGSLTDAPRKGQVSDDKLSAIIEEFRNTGITMYDLTEKYHISRRTIMNYIERKR